MKVESMSRSFSWEELSDNFPEIHRMLADDWSSLNEMTFEVDTIDIGLKSELEKMGFPASATRFAVSESRDDEVTEIRTLS